MSGPSSHSSVGEEGQTYDIPPSHLAVESSYDTPRSTRIWSVVVEGEVQYDSPRATLAG